MPAASAPKEAHQQKPQKKPEKKPPAALESGASSIAKHPPRRKGSGHEEPVAARSVVSVAAATPATAAGSLLDGCWHVYLDVGTNVGNQIRKVFEPQRFPLAPILPVYDTYFGTSRARAETVCAVGFEPNAVHETRLGELAQRYNALGYRTHMMLNVAAATREGNVTFFRDVSFSGKRNHEWGASMVRPTSLRLPHQRQLVITVPTVDLAQWIRREVLQRRLPARPAGAAPGPPRVMMKLDIEGAEHRVLPHLLEQGVLCRLDYMYAEYHTVPPEAGYDAHLEARMRNATSSCGLELTSLDDEIPFSPTGPHCKAVFAKPKSPMEKWRCYEVPPLP